MPHKHIQKALFYLVTFIKKTTSHHKKKLITLVVIALLTYIAKKKLHLAHLLQLAQKITQIISYLPLPQFPTYRNLNKYESPRLNPLAQQIIAAMNIDQIKSKIKLKQATWDQLKISIFSGTILSLILYNIQSFYFVVQNKYQSDFVQLGAIQMFDQLMGGIRRKFLTQMTNIKDTLKDILQSIINKINLKQQFSLDQYFGFIDQMMQRIFDSKYTVIKQSNQNVQKSIYKGQQPYQVAKNYFMTTYEYNPKKKSRLSRISSSISRFTQRFNFKLFKEAVCQISEQRFEWTKIAYQQPFKKSLTDTINWPNRQSQLLSKLVITEIDQIISSTNFSTLIYENAKYNSSVLKNRLFLYFGKNELRGLRTAQSLAVFYKLIKEQVLISGPHSGLKQGEQNKRQRFYQMQIMKAIRQKKVHQSSQIQQNDESELLIRSDKKQLKAIMNNRQDQQVNNDNKGNKISNELIQCNIQKVNPQIILLNMHLQQIYQSRQLNYLVKQFELKYFNQRSGITIKPMQQGKLVRGGSQQDEMKKMLSMLVGNEQLNKNQ